MKSFINDSKRQFSICILLIFLSSMAESLFIYFQADIINGMSVGTVLSKEIVIFTIVFSCSIIFGLFRIFSVEKVFCKVTVNIKKTTLKAFYHKDYHCFSDKEIAQEYSFLFNEVNTMLNQGFYMTLYMIQQIVAFVFSVVVLFVFNWLLGLIAVFIALIFFFASKKIGKKIIKSQTDLQNNNVQFTAKLTEMVQGFDAIHFNQIEKFAEKEIENIAKDNERYKYIYNKKMLLVESFNISGNILVYLCVFVIGILFALNGHTQLGIIVSIAELSYQVVKLGTGIVMCYSKIQGTKKIKEKWIKYISTDTKATRLNINSQDSNTVLELKNLNYSYDGKKNILCNANIKIQKGKKYAIIAESGGGKSTALEIFANLKTPDSGEISMSEKPIYISQKPFIIKDTVLNNIKLFNKDAENSKIEKALYFAQLTQEENGLHKNIMLEQNGSNISDGQKMRVALARAFASNRKFFLFDEPTAALNQQMGQKIEENIINLGEDITVCYVSHKLYYPEKFDEILYLRDKKFVNEVSKNAK